MKILSSPHRNSILNWAIFSSVCFLILRTQPVSANIVGVGTQNFNTVTDGIDFITVNSSETLRPGVFNLGLFFNYAVNTLPYFETTPGTRSKFNDSLFSSDFNVGVGLLKNWEAGLSFPYILSQTVKDSTGARGDFAKSGITEVRLNSKYRFWGEDDYGIAVVSSVNLNLIRDDPFAGAGSKPGINVELVGDTTIHRVALALNVGYRFKNPGTATTALITPLDDQFIASTAASYLLPNNTKLIAEIYGALPAKRHDGFANRSNTSAEVIVGAKHAYNHNFSAHIGAGTELAHSTASPDWRIYTGVNYTFGPLWDKPIPDVVDFGETKSVESFSLESILFKFNSTELNPEYEYYLSALARHLAKKPAFSSLVIEGHTDSIGAAAYNEKLSQQRAQSIKNYLVQVHGLDGRKIQALGYGESRPIADNGNYQGRQKNRRVAFKITRPAL